MRLVLLAHPLHLGLRSQDRFAALLAEGFAARGHDVEVRRPDGRWRAGVPARLAKWAGYADQFVRFPRQLRQALAGDPPETLYVLCDQALGPWMPLLAQRPHVVHCHDLLALRSALGLIPENPTRWSGRVYQRWIRGGLAHARHFVSVSEATRADLHRHAGVRPATSRVVLNGLNHPYRRLDAATARARLASAGLDRLAGPMLLHVGGGQWYKNTAGVVALYAALAAGRARVPPLVVVGPLPDPALAGRIAALPAHARVHFVSGVGEGVLEAMYSMAGALLFPSLAEGFGWPVAEALSCGCPVLTTGEAPMTEVGGEHALYLPRLAPPERIEDWARQGAAQLAALLDRPAHARADAAAAAVEWARRYDPARAIDETLRIYEAVLACERAPGRGSAWGVPLVDR